MPFITWLKDVAEIALGDFVGSDMTGAILFGALILIGLIFRLVRRRATGDRMWEPSNLILIGVIGVFVFSAMALGGYIWQQFYRPPVAASPPVATVQPPVITPSAPSSPPAIPAKQPYRRMSQGEGVIRIADSANIPADPRNADWQTYQAWLSAGNSPDQPYATLPPAYAARAPSDADKEIPFLDNIADLINKNALPQTQEIRDLLVH